MRDQHRAAVYAAEDQVARVLDRGGPVDFFGSTLTMPVERRFADIASIRRYVAAVADLTAVRRAWPDLSPPAVRERRGLRRATYSEGVIAIPLAGPVEHRWAARETVILHEYAHHASVAVGQPPHGPIFCASLIHLIDTVIGAEASLMLRASLVGAGVPIAHAPWAVPA